MYGSSQEFNLPKVKGTTVQELRRIFIYLQALLLLLDVFSGPMDFLLYLIQKEESGYFGDRFSRNYRSIYLYIELMEDFEYELAGDYLAMAAYLAEVKSRILLPREEEDEISDDQKQNQPEDCKKYVKLRGSENFRCYSRNR